MRCDAIGHANSASAASTISPAPRRTSPWAATWEFFERPEWSALRAAYGLKFSARRQYQPTFMYRAVVSGAVDVIPAFSSDGRIAADDLVLLDDPRHALLSYDAIVLLAPRRAGDAQLRQALQPLIGSISIQAMREANLSVDRDADKQTPAAAARQLAVVGE